MIAKRLVQEATAEDFKTDDPSLLVGSLFKCSAEEIYPVVIADITSKLADPTLCDNTSAEQTYLEKAKRLPPEAFVDALADEVLGMLSNPRLVDRAKALEIARKYFTAKLKEECGGPMGLKILCQPEKKFKLHVVVEV